MSAIEDPTPTFDPPADEADSDPSLQNASLHKGEVVRWAGMTLVVIWALLVIAMPLLGGLAYRILPSEARSAWFAYPSLWVPAIGEFIWIVVATIYARRKRSWSPVLGVASVVGFEICVIAFIAASGQQFHY